MWENGQWLGFIGGFAGDILFGLSLTATVPSLYCCIKSVRCPGIQHYPHARLPPFPGHGCMDDLTVERSFDLQATRVIDVLDLFFDMLSMHWRRTGRLVQELNVCTVASHVCAEKRNQRVFSCTVAAFMRVGEYMWWEYSAACQSNPPPPPRNSGGFPDQSSALSLQIILSFVSRRVI